MSIAAWRGRFITGGVWGECRMLVVALAAI